MISSHWRLFHSLPSGAVSCAQVVSFGHMPPLCPGLPQGLPQPASTLRALHCASGDSVPRALKVVFRRFNLHGSRFGASRMDRKGWHRVVHDAGLVWEQDRRRGALLFQRPRRQDSLPRVNSRHHGDDAVVRCGSASRWAVNVHSVGGAQN